MTPLWFTFSLVVAACAVPFLHYRLCGHRLWPFR